MKKETDMQTEEKVNYWLLNCPCGQPVHLFRYVGCKPDVPVYYCEYGELHEGEDPDARKNARK